MGWREEGKGRERRQKCISNSLPPLSQQLLFTEQTSASALAVTLPVGLCCPDVEWGHILGGPKACTLYLPNSCGHLLREEETRATCAFRSPRWVSQEPLLFSLQGWRSRRAPAFEGLFQECAQNSFGQTRVVRMSCMQKRKIRAVQRAIEPQIPSRGPRSQRLRGHQPWEHYWCVQALPAPKMQEDKV